MGNSVKRKFYHGADRSANEAAIRQVAEDLRNDERTHNPAARMEVFKPLGAIDIP